MFPEIPSKNIEVGDLVLQWYSNHGIIVVAQPTVGICVGFHDESHLPILLVGHRLDHYTPSDLGRSKFALVAMFRDSVDVS